MTKYRLAAGASTSTYELWHVSDSPPVNYRLGYFSRFTTGERRFTALHPLALREVRIAAQVLEKLEKNGEVEGEWEWVN